MILTTADQLGLSFQFERRGPYMSFMQGHGGAIKYKRKEKIERKKGTNNRAISSHVVYIVVELIRADSHVVWRGIRFNQPTVSPSI